MEEESENSQTFHSAIYIKLRLLSTSSDGIAIEDADSEERDTDQS